MRVCYFDCWAGAAGDMVLGALLDVGVPQEVVDEALGALGLERWSLTVGEATRGGLRAKHVTVIADQQTDARSFSDIDALLDSSDIGERVRILARATFRTLGEAEARVHGVALDEVHFHEVGALDAIVDIVGACAAFAHLAADRTIVSALPLGDGFVSTAHGTLPVPVPAVTEILSSAGAPVVAGGEGETVTPTGAALLVTFADSFGAHPPMRLQRSGYGAGTRDATTPNVVRVLLGEFEQASTPSPEAVVIEVNLDDMSPELVAYASDRVLRSGASDAWVTPIVMKKSRAAVMLSVLVTPLHRDRVLEVLFAETSTLGARLLPVEKVALGRDFVTVEVQGQVVRVKQGLYAGEVVNRAPEYEDARAAAEALGLPLKEIYALALEAARGHSSSPRRPS
jgi:uncharacterized protein (TIGR00299 family) protein